jgi:hypothetical protein
MPYELDTVDGSCLYRGNDLALACELHDQVPTARLFILTAVGSQPNSPPHYERRRPWKGPSSTLSETA